MAGKKAVTIDVIVKEGKNGLKKLKLTTINILSATAEIPFYNKSCPEIIHGAALYLRH